MSPNFPRYNSQAALNTQPNAVMREGSSDTSNIINKAAGQVSDIAMKWTIAVDNMAETAIKSNMAKGVAQLNQDSISDPDINGEKDKIEQLKKLRSSAMGKGLQNKSTEQQLGMELDTQTYLATLEINNIYAKKKLLADNLNTTNLLENYAGIRSQALQIGNNTVVEETDKKAFELIQGKVATQILSEAQGKEAWKSYRLGSVDFDIQSDPSTLQKGSPVLQELLKGKEGRYSFLANDELADKIKASKINIWRNKVAQEKAIQEEKTTIALDLSNKLANGALSLTDVQKIGRDDPKTAAIFDNAIDVKQREIDDPENKTAEYLLKLLDNDKATALDVLTKAAEYRGTKNFDDNVYGWVVQEVAKKFDREKKGLSGWDKATEAFKNGAKSINAFAGVLGPVGILSNIMINKFTQKVKTGTDPDVAKTEVINEQLTEQIDKTKLTIPAQEIEMISPDGRRFKVAPDKVDKALNKGFKRAE
ncbi:MAG: hypothetical protein WC332_01655 [Clostridia bacterium]|jgi:hypothetical protein